MIRLVSFFLILFSYPFFAQDSSSTGVRVDILLLQRSYSQRIKDIKVNNTDKYKTLNYGIQLIVPILRTNNSTISISGNYSRSIPKKWNLLTSGKISQLTTIKTELYSAKGHYRLNIGNFLIGISAGIHQDKLSVNNSNYFSQTLPGYGFSLSYTKSIKLFRTRLRFLLPIFQSYKVKDNNIYWGLQIPVYNFQRKK